MTASVVQAVKGTLVASDAATVTSTLTNAIVAGDIVVALIGTNSSGTNHSVAGLGATWTRAAKDALGLLDLWVGVGATSTGTVTATLTTSVAGGFKQVNLWHVRGTTSVVVAGADNATGDTLVGTAMTAGPGQIFIGSGYSDTPSNGFSSPVPATGWVGGTSDSMELSTGARYATIAHRIPTAFENHKFSTVRTGSTAHPIVRLVLGTLAVPIRTNLFTHPSAEGSAITWTTVLNSSSVSRSSAQAIYGTESYAWLTGGGGHHETITPTGTSGFPVTAGGSYSASVYFRATAAMSTTLYLHWYDAAGAEITSVNTSSMTSSTTAWQRLGGTFLAPAGAAFAAIKMRLSSTTGVQTVYLDGFLLEYAATVDSYFDGSMGGSVWNGTAHASTSTYTDLIPPRTNYCANPSFEVNTTAWDLGGLTRVTSQFYVGTASAQTPVLSTGALSIAYGFASNAKTASSIAVVPDDVWTISFYAKSVSVASHSVGIRTIWMNSGGAFVSDTGNTLNTTVMTGGWTRVTATVTIPASIAWMGFAPVGSAAIYMDAVLIEKAGYAGSYFDGTSFTPGLVHAWTGTAHASNSTVTVGVPAQTSSAAESVLLHAGIESSMPLKSEAVEPVLMNVAPADLPVSTAIESVLSNVLEKELDTAGPGVIGVYTGSVVTTANPTMNFTATLEAGDVLIAAVLSGANSESATAISGLGATWTRINGAANYLYSFWMGTGASGTGTITATGAAATQGKTIRVHHLRGIEPFAFAQSSQYNYMRAGSSQVAIGYAYTTGAGAAINQTTKVPGPAWTDDTEIAFLSGSNKANTTHMRPNSFVNFWLEGANFGLMMVVGSPVPGATVTDKTLTYNGGFETGTTGWLGSNGTLAWVGNALFGTACARITGTGSAPQLQKWVSNAPGSFCIPGQTYTASAYVKSVNARSARVNIRWGNISGSMSSTTNGTTVALSAGGDWVRLTCTGVAPAGQWTAGVSVELTNGVSADVFYIDGVKVDDGGTALPYFDSTVTTPDRINIDYPSGYSLQTTVPPDPTPTVVGVFVGAVTTAANPTVEMTNTPIKRDVLILTDGRGNTGAGELTAVAGCGATWTRIPGLGDGPYSSYWIGVGATFAGTVTATGPAHGSGRHVRVHHLRGVTTDVHMQIYKASSPVVATPNQIVLAIGASQSSTGSVVIPEPATGWVMDAETAHLPDRRLQTATLIPRYPFAYNAAGGGYANVLVIGSPVAGMSVTRRNLVNTSGFESTGDAWLASGASSANRTLSISAVGIASLTANYNGTTATIFKGYGNNPPCGAVLPGHTYTLSGWVRCNNARDATIGPYWLGTGQGLLSTGTATAVPIAANTWTRFSWTGVAPAGAYFVTPFARFENVLTGDVYWIDGFLVEEGATVGEYFDGWTDPPAEKMNYFVGLGDDSQSLQLSPIPPVLETNFNVLESGIWVSHVGTPKVYIDGSWVSVAAKYWDGDEWIDLVTE